MVTDYFNSVYQQKVNFKGENNRGKAISRGTNEFARYLATTPTRQDVIRLNAPEFVQGDSLEVSIQGPSFQNIIADRYEKIILGKLEDSLDVGNIIEWEDENWLIVTQEKLSIPTHFRGKVRFCNHYLKWNQQNAIHTVPGHVITSRAFALEEGQKAGLTWDEAAMVILAIIPSNEITRTISRYHRFIIKDKAWQVVSTDILSVEQLLFVRLEEDQINRATDDMENGIADRYKPIDDTEDTIEGNEYQLLGDNKIIWNGNAIYNGYLNSNVDSGATFSIDDTNLATIEGDNVNPVKVRANNNGLVGNFTLTCTFNTGHILSKDIQVVSLWGG